MRLLVANASIQRLYSSVRFRNKSLVMGPDWCRSRKKWTMFSGRVNKGMWPRMTMRSKQWYTKASRLPNSVAKVSIGRLPVFLTQQQDHRTDGRCNQRRPWDRRKGKKRFKGKKPQVSFPWATKRRRTHRPQPESTDARRLQNFKY